MKKHLLQFLTILSLAAADKLQGQGVLISFLNPATNEWEIGSYDLDDCTYETVIAPVDRQIGDFLQADDGTFYMVGAIPGGQGGFGEAGLFTIDPTTGVTTLLVNLGGPFLQGTVLQLDPTTLIIAHANNFYSYDISSGMLTLLGTGNLSHFPELFSYQGNVYLTYLNPSGGNQNWLTQLNFSPFSGTPIVQTGALVMQTEVCGNVFGFGSTLFGSTFSLSEANMNNYTQDLICNDLSALNGVSPFSLSLAPDPNNDSGPLCDCETESGTITPGFYQACGQNPITIPHLGNETLDGDDALVFLLVAPPYNYPTSAADVLHIYETPVATFIPGVTQVGVFYRIYPAAANAISPGSIDFEDECLEIGEHIVVRWTPGPTVNFTLLSQNCTTGCQTVRANFTGSPPFTLTYSISTNDGQTSTFTQTSTSSILNLNVCPPAGYSGELTVQGTNLVDAVCTCSQ